MKLELDKSYKTRNNNIVRRILAVDRNNEAFPVVAELMSGTIFVYTAEGNYTLQHEHPFDIVAEYQ